jgi:hypothetical protein
MSRLLRSLSNLVSVDLINRSRVRGTIALAQSEGIRYFSCRGDYWWRALHTCDDAGVINALARTHLALAFPNTGLNVRGCTQLPTKPSAERKIEFDSCLSLSNGDIGITSFGGPQSEQCIAMDIARRGAVIFAEMQQRRKTVTLSNNSSRDELPLRLDDYASFAAARDHGNPSGRRGDVRSGKVDGDEISRSVVSLGYYCYGDRGRIERDANSAANGLRANDPQQAHHSRGDAFAMVSLGKAENRESVVTGARRRFHFPVNGELDRDQQRQVADEYDRIVLEKIQHLKSTVSDCLPGIDILTKELVGQILAVFSMSHLFTTNIVSEFSVVVQRMCSILEVNMENIRKAGLSEEQVKNLLGNFDRVRVAEAERDVERERRVADRRRVTHALRARIGQPVTPGLLRELGIESSSANSAASTPA